MRPGRAHCTGPGNAAAGGPALSDALAAPATASSARPAGGRWSWDLPSASGSSASRATTNSRAGRRRLYSSAIVMRVSPDPPWVEAAIKRGAAARTAGEQELAVKRMGIDKPPPDDGLPPDIPFELVRGKRFAFNGPQLHVRHHSPDLARHRGAGRKPRCLPRTSSKPVIITSNSIIAVAEGRADVCSDRLPILAYGRDARTQGRGYFTSSAGRACAKACR